MNNRTVICWREDSCQQLLTVWRKNGLSAVKLCAQREKMAMKHRSSSPLLFSPDCAAHRRETSDSLLWSGSPAKAFKPQAGNA